MVELVYVNEVPPWTQYRGGTDPFGTRYNMEDRVQARQVDCTDGEELWIVSSLTHNAARKTADANRCLGLWRVSREVSRREKVKPVSVR